MMTGTITNLRPHLELFVKGIGGQGKVSFVVDTGYNGTLTLPPEVCVALQLKPENIIRSQLADGTRIKLQSYILLVEWDGEERKVEILATGEEPLLGVTMLEGYKLCLDFSANTLTVELA